MPLIPHHRRSISVLCFALYVLLGAVLLLRPHQETFIGLDSSAIRMMTHAMAQGRDQMGLDQTLLDVPADIRANFLYMPDHGQRLTRDRSFQLDNLETCTYRPWFYPLLSYAAQGFDWIAPGTALDFFLPTLALLFFISCGWFMFRQTGLPGLAASAGVLFSMPLLFWFARGYYPELAGLLLVALAALYWVESKKSRRGDQLYFFTLGFATCFHPLLALWTGALLLLTLVHRRSTPRQSLLAVLCWPLGALPLIFITHYVTQPYGDIFNPHWLYAVFSGDTLYFLLLLGALITCALICLVLLPFGQALLHALLFAPGSRQHILRLIMALVPLLLLLLVPHTRPQTLGGLRDLGSLLVSPFGLVAMATIFASILPGVRPAPRALLIMTVALASVFLYLKGLEPFGLWSQRRLLPITIPFLVAALGIWRDVFLAWTNTSWKPRLTSGAFVLLAAIMLVQHTPLYWLRSEQGSNDILRHINQLTARGLTIFDYHQYGSPLAALGHTPTLALSNRISTEQRTSAIQWAALEAHARPVIWATAFDNPGLEQGVALEHVASIDQNLPRLTAKQALPVALRDHNLSIQFLTMRPLEPGHKAPSLDKVLGPGHLALRGAWGRSDIALSAPDGAKLPARWTREGSGIIGPVPKPGESVRVEMTAGAYRGDELDHQVMFIVPPWDGPPLQLYVNNPYTMASGTLHRPHDATLFKGITGQYDLHSQHPYDPSLAGIGGFSPDLGVLLHRIRMDVLEE